MISRVTVDQHQIASVTDIPLLSRLASIADDVEKDLAAYGESDDIALTVSYYLNSAVYGAGLVVADPDCPKCRLRQLLPNHSCVKLPDGSHFHNLPLTQVDLPTQCSLRSTCRGHFLLTCAINPLWRPTYHWCRKFEKCILPGLRLLEPDGVTWASRYDCPCGYRREFPARSTQDQVAEDLD